MNSSLVTRARALSESIDGSLREFGAIDTQRKPWSYECSSSSAPSYPTFYIDRSPSPEVMGLTGEGEAKITYKVVSRSVDEDTQDGVPLYGVNLRVTSIEPVKAAAKPAPAKAMAARFTVRELAEDRQRDGAGRFAAGSVPGPEDFALAKKKKAGLLGGGLLAGGGLAAMALRRKAAAPRLPAPVI